MLPNCVCNDHSLQHLYGNANWEVVSVKWAVMMV